MQARLVVISLFDGVQSLDVAGPLEVFTGAAGSPRLRRRDRGSDAAGIRARSWVPPSVYRQRF